MKLLILLLLVQPCCAQLFLANAADGSQTNFAPGSLILTNSPTLTISPFTSVPILNTTPQGLFIGRLPINLPLGPATVSGTSSQPVSIEIVRSSFGIFTGNHFAQKNNGPLVGLTLPAHPGDYLTIYGTGLGAATPSQVTVTVAGLPVPVTYAGPAPGEPGVDQINVLIPAGLAAPDSCYDAFAITIAGVPVTPKALSYTQSAATCPSSFGFTPSELTQIDAGTQVNIVQLSLQSQIRPAIPQDNAGAGFIPPEFADAFEQIALPQLNAADSVFYSCQSQQQLGDTLAILAEAYSGLSLTMGAASIPIGPGLPSLPLSTAVATPDALPPGIFQPGTWQLTAGNFSQPIQLPPLIDLQNFTALQSIDSTRDLTIVWNVAGYSAADVVSLNLAASSLQQWLTSTGTFCHARATSGSITVPAAQLMLLPSAVNIIASVSPHPDQAPHFRLPQPDGSTLPLQLTYSFSETFPVTIH